MRRIILIALLMTGPFLAAQAWTQWEVTPTITKDAVGYESYQSIKGKDSSGASWQISWGKEAVTVTAPDGVRKTLDKTFPVEAHPHGGMAIGEFGTQRWMDRNWECLRVRIDTGRNGIGLDYYLVMVIDRRTRDWSVCSGRVSDGSLEGPLLRGDNLVFRWSDEEDKRPLRVKHEWRISHTSTRVRVSTPPMIYQLEYGYPYWFRFWSDRTSPNPDIAEHQGWKSVAWRIVRASAEGGRAHAPRTAIPKEPGKQVWRRGGGPDIWFPEKGTHTFRWEEEVEVRRFARAPEKVAPAIAFNLAASGDWDVILSRDSGGKYLGSMLIERESSGCGRFPDLGFDGPEMRSFQGAYTNPNFGFSVVIPEGLVGHDAPAPMPHHGFGIVLSWEPRAYVWVNGEYNSLEWESLSEATRQLLTWNRADHRKVLSSSISHERIGGRPAERITLKYECPESRIRRVLFEAVFMRDQTRKTVYQFGLDTTEGRAKDDLKVFEALLSSWKMVPVD